MLKLIVIQKLNTLVYVEYLYFNLYFFLKLNSIGFIILNSMGEIGQIYVNSVCVFGMSMSIMVTKNILPLFINSIFSSKICIITYLTSHKPTEIFDYIRRTWSRTHTLCCLWENQECYWRYSFPCRFSNYPERRQGCGWVSGWGLWLNWHVSRNLVCDVREPVIFLEEVSDVHISS